MSSTFTAALGSKLCVAVRSGLSRAAAAGKVGVSPDRLRHWLASSERGELIDGEGFFEEFQIAEAAGMAAHEEAMARMAKSRVVSSANVKAQDIILSRRYPKEWSPKSHVQHTGKDGGPIGVAHGITLIDFLRPAYDKELGERKRRFEAYNDNVAAEVEGRQLEPAEDDSPLDELMKELASG